MSLRRPATYINPHGNVRQTQPAQEPISLSEFKTHLRVTDSSEDAYLSQLIVDATQEIEDTTGLALISQTWKLTLDRWPMSRERWWDGEAEGHVNIIYDGAKWAAVTIPRYPLISVDAVTVYSENSSATSITVANVFDIDTSFLRGRMALKQGATWPVALRSIGAIDIDYTAGFGTKSVHVPAAIKRAIRQFGAYMYEHRGDGCDPKDALRLSGAMSILDRYRDMRV